MTYLMDYAVISPAVLAEKISKVCGNALCMWDDINEDYYQFKIMGQVPLTANNVVAIEKVLAPYV